jgi:hypothetical protein
MTAMRDPMTIITTVRDGEAFLHRYFANLSQTLGPHDHAVMVDDGSSIPVEAPPDWKDDPRLTILHPGKVGRGAALNLAIESSPTDLIAIQDIDDISLPGRLDHQARHLCKDPGQLVFARALSDKKMRGSGKLQHFSPARLYAGNPLHHSSLAMHRSVWARAGGYAPDLPCCIDLDFYLRACGLAKARIIRLKRPLIKRTLNHATRHFARIPDALYRETRAAVLARHRPNIAWSVWITVAKLREFRAYIPRRTG